MICEFFKKCPFYNDKLPSEWGPGNMLKKKFCETDKNACARYQVAVAVGREYVPADLFPTRNELAAQIIEKVKQEKSETRNFN